MQQVFFPQITRSAELSAASHSPSTSEHKRRGQCGEVARAKGRDAARAILPVAIQTILRAAATVAPHQRVATAFHFRLHAANKSGINFLASASGIGLWSISQ